MSGKEYLSLEDYIARLAAECHLSLGRAEAAVRDGLALSKCVRRRGWYSDEHRLHVMENGEPDPGPGPSKAHLPIHPVWIERNLYARVEYSVADLDFETRHLPRPATFAPPQKPRRGPVRGTTDKVRQDRVAMIPMIDELMASGTFKSTTAAVDTILEDRLPGNGTPDSRRLELVKVYNAQRACQAK
jgi:hypothetical protein